MTESDFNTRLEALAVLALNMGGTLTYAERLLIGKEIGGRLHLYDENGDHLRIDDAPPLRPRTPLLQAGAREIDEPPAPTSPE